MQPSAVITLIGNKCDLEHLRVVQKEQAKAFASENQLAFLETSALDSRNVEEAFTWLVKEVYNVVTSSNGIADNDKDEREKGPVVSIVTTNNTSKEKKKKKVCDDGSTITHTTQNYRAAVVESKTNRDLREPSTVVLRTSARVLSPSHTHTHTHTPAFRCGSKKCNNPLLQKEKHTLSLFSLIPPPPPSARTQTPSPLHRNTPAAHTISIKKPQTQATATAPAS